MRPYHVFQEEEDPDIKKIKKVKIKNPHEVILLDLGHHTQMTTNYNQHFVSVGPELHARVAV